MVNKTDQKIAEIIIQKGKNMLMKGLRLSNFSGQDF